MFWLLATVLAWRPLAALGDRLYAWVADNRPCLAAFSERFFPWRSRRIRPTIVGSLLATAFLDFITVQNVSTVPATAFRLPKTFTVVRQFFGLYQFWTMFAPSPEVVSPWPIIEGKLKDGTIVDVYNHKPGAPSFARPEIVSAVYAN